MKVLKKSMLLLLTVLAVTISSCSSDDDGPGPIVDPILDGHGILTAKVDGGNFQSLPEEAEAFVGVIDGVQFVSIGGEDQQGRGLAVVVNGFTGVGTYNFAQMGESYASGMYSEGDDGIWTFSMLVNNTGEIIITEYSENQRIKGTFHFEAYNPINETVKSITNGVFDVWVGTGSL